MLKKKKLEIIRKWYPNAITTIDCINKVIDYFEGELDIEPSSVMLADSICSDDVNSIQFPYRASEFLGPFKLGGLDGFPFAGLTGMGAFASHIPDDGAVFIYYGPHIGITKSGTIGEIHRFGQSKNSTCCGAAHAAVNKLSEQKIIRGKVEDMDYQMNTIEQIVYNEKENILSAENRMFEATEVIYKAIDKRINELVEKTHYNCHYIVLMGTILINSDSDMGSFTSIKRYDLINLKTGERKSLMDLI